MPETLNTLAAQVAAQSRELEECRRKLENSQAQEARQRQALERLKGLAIAHGAWAWAWEEENDA